MLLNDTHHKFKLVYILNYSLLTDKQNIRNPRVVKDRPAVWVETGNKIRFLIGVTN